MSDFIKTRHELSPASLELVAARFRVLGEPNRLRLLAEMQDGERCVNDLAGATGLTQANVSRHLQSLLQSGLLNRRKAGLQVLRAVRSLTRKPVAAVILTHAHPENVLAAGVVAGRDAPVIASHRTYALMRDRCSECLTRLTGLTGESAMSGTNIRLPDQTVAAGTTDRTYGGRRLKLIHTGWGHTAGDLAVLDVASGTLFTGGLANNRVMPDMHEAQTRGWVEALRILEAMAPVRVVPGEGAPAGAELLSAMRGYLAALLERVEATYRQQGSVFEVLSDGDLPAYAGWVRYADGHALNIQHVYAELEKEDFATR